jgi:dsDNA-binding SOS-regulon protein
VISFIVRLIFSVSEVNKNFSNSKKLQEQEKNIFKAKEKINKQNELLSKISLLKESLTKKASFLKNENSEAKSKLLARMRVEE